MNNFKLIHRIDFELLTPMYPSLSPSNHQPLACLPGLTFCSFSVYFVPTCLSFLEMLTRGAGLPV